MTSAPPLNVLFLCTGNSARSILAEAILNQEGRSRFRAFSAGSQPRGEIWPQALRLLETQDHSTSGLRSKSWDEFAAPHAPEPHVIVTVRDNAAGEVCPLWPGQPVTAHWSLPDPAVAGRSEAAVAQAFAEVYRALQRRIEAFVALPLEVLDRASIKRHIDEIGRTAETSERGA